MSCPNTSQADVLVRSLQAAPVQVLSPVQVQVPVLLEALQDGFVSRLLEEAQQVVWPEPHAGGVGHGVEVDHLVASLHQVPVQDELHTLVLIKEQSESRRTPLTHLRGHERTREDMRGQRD